MNNLENRLRTSFDRQVKWMQGDIKRISEKTNLHEVMFSLCTRSLQEAFIKDTRHAGMVGGNRTVEQCRDIIDFVDDYVLGEDGIVLDENGHFRHSRQIGLSEEQIEEALYIWDKIIKLEYVAFQWLYEDEEAYRSHLRQIQCLKVKLRTIK
jgi:hypothetical protein